MPSALDPLAQLAVAVGEPRLESAPVDQDDQALEANAAVIVDALLGRLLRVSRLIDEGGAHGHVDPVAGRLLLTDLAMLVSVLRALNRHAAGRLTQASAALGAAREALARSPGGSPFEPIA